MSNPIEIKIDNKAVESKLLDLAQKSENLRLLMKNIAGIFAYSTEENFKNDGRPDKWTDLAETTKKQRTKTGHYPGQILQVSGQLASSISTYYDMKNLLRNEGKDLTQIKTSVNQMKNVYLYNNEYERKAIKSFYEYYERDDFKELLLSINYHLRS